MLRKIGSNESTGAYSPDGAQAMKARSLDIGSNAAHGLCYERLDQLTNEILLGIR
jgi:xylose isomerase